MKWYSVKKYRPPFDGSYICVWKNGISQLDLYNGNWWFVNHNGEELKIHYDSVTHFCIPDPIELEE